MCVLFQIQTVAALGYKQQMRPKGWIFSSLRARAAPICQNKQNNLIKIKKKTRWGHRILLCQTRRRCDLEINKVELQRHSGESSRGRFSACILKQKGRKNKKLLLRKLKRTMYKEPDRPMLLARFLHFSALGNCPQCQRGCGFAASVTVPSLAKRTF